jgi:hypothetical protein
MKKAFVKKFLDDPKYFRAYWIITTEQLSRIEAKVDLIQYELCKGGSIAGLPFLNPKRKKAEQELAKKHNAETHAMLALLMKAIALGESDEREALNKKKNR